MEAQFLEKLNSLKKKQLKAEKITRKKYEEQQKMMKSLKTYAQELTLNQSPEEMMRNRTYLLVRMKQLFKDQKEINKDKLMTIKVIFTPATLPDSQQSEEPGLVGRLCFLNGNTT